MATILSYTDYLQTDAWKERARAAKDRAGWRCAVCPSGVNLEAHHRTYERVGCELPEDLVVLCGWCHRRHHGTYEECRDRQLMLPFVVLKEDKAA
jgi:hypothetical protein